MCDIYLINFVLRFLKSLSNAYIYALYFFILVLTHFNCPAKNRKKSLQEIKPSI